jgi:SAM-dependent methyltransferase
VLTGTATTYDLLPYSSKPYALTHPDNLATIAALAGLRTPSLERCRVLELGCGAGGNLIPMAMSLPGATFVGVDLSRRQIADARSMADALRLTNVDFRAHDLADIDEALGVFDFIVCHGVFSWVPATLREAILAVCRRNLGPDGVAYVSYNVYPGWHLKGLVRDMLLYRIGGDGEPQARVQRARSVLGEIAREVTDRRDSYSRLLRDEVTKVAGASDTYLFHEYLEDVNQPFYFHRFVEMATAHGLRYVGDARSRIDARSAADPVRHEQEHDFLVMRSFRRSLLCHADVRIDPAVGAASLRYCHARARARPVSAAPDVASDRAEDFRLPSGRIWSTSDRVDKALLVTVAASHPATLSVVELAEETGRLLDSGPDTDDMAETLAVGLRRCWAAELIDLHLRPPRLPERIARRPTASPLARMQARTGAEVTNLRHHTVELDSVARAMLNVLDGTHDRAALAAELGVLARAVPSATAADGDVPATSESWHEDIEGSIERMLRYLQRSALLVS